jgi:uncharacterized membrane protein
LAGFAYYILSRTLISHHGQDSMLATAIGTDRKGRLSLVAYLVAVGVAFLNVWISQAIYVAVAIIWLIPDRRIERVVGHGA